MSLLVITDPINLNRFRDRDLWDVTDKRAAVFELGRVIASFRR